MPVVLRGTGAGQAWEVQGMGGRRLRRVGALVAAAALLVAACGDDEDATEGGATTTEAPADDGEATTTTAGDEGGPLTITAVDYGFEGLPDELPAGVLEFDFVNEGEADHEIAFVEIGDTDPEQFFTDFAPVIAEGAAFPEYAVNVIGANEAAAGESASYAYTLPAGTFMAFCSLTGTPEAPDGEEGAPHFELGMQQVVTVTEGEAGELEEADGTIAATDYGFEPDVSAGDTVINFRNDGPDEIHFASLSVYPEGTTAEQAEEQFQQLLQSEEGPPPPGVVEPEEVAFSGIASAGLGIRFEVPGGFESGRTYLAACFIQDRAGGPPHAIAYQMYEAFTVE